MRTKELTDSDLGISTSNQTHIGLHEDMVSGWSEKDRTYNVYLFVDGRSAPFPCEAVINGITSSSGALRSPKIKTGNGISDDKNLLRLIRKHGSSDRRWLTVAQLPDDTLLVFLGKRQATIDSITEEALVIIPDEAGNELFGISERFARDTASRHLRFDVISIHRFIAALLSKRFCLLSGLAGSGKTKLAQAFARWSTESSKNYNIVPVGADWTGNENILGYPDGLNTTHYVNKPALDLILNAADNANVPHFLILDEMNLSHVERYFADILSAIESDEGLELYSGDMTKPETWRKTAAGNPVQPRLKQLPENLFIIGTVNVDETTYMFSPKVLDRANVIEFRLEPDELQSFLSNPSKPDLSELDSKGASFGKAFVDAAKNAVAIPADVKSEYDSEMLLFFETLQDHGAEFGYRTAYETARFIHYYKLLGNHADGDTTWFHGAFDCVILQKMLPKLHGSRAKLGPILKMLWFLCVNEPAGRDADAIDEAKKAPSSTDKHEPSKKVPAGAPYPMSAEKIGRMWRLLIENGFASFAEA